VTTVGPDGEGHTLLEAPRALTAIELGSVRNGGSAIFVHGSIFYRDIYGKRRTTTYRYYVGGDQGIREDGFLAGHSEGNKAT
jgi:hypothetical protein